MERLKLCRVLMFAIALVIVAYAPYRTLSAPLNQTLPGCKSTCGNVEIPYPFGIGNSSTQPCYLEPVFSLTCDDNSKLKWFNVTVISISVLAHQMDVWYGVSRFCKPTYDNPPRLTINQSSISRKENKFVTVGCDSYGYLDSVYNNKRYTTGCLTRCYGNELVIDDGTCSGIGCCQVDIPPRMTNISLNASSFSVDTGRRGPAAASSAHLLSTTNRGLPAETHVLSNVNLTCSYSFVVKHDSYKFNTSHLDSFPYEERPLVLDWIVGNKSCSAFNSSRADYACKENSYCDDKDTDYGYRCICNSGYEGNPYLGCTDIDECKTTNHTCISQNNCLNTNGSYECFCPKGRSGNGKKEEGCHQKDVTKVVIGVAAGIVILCVGTTSLYLIYQKRKLNKLRQKYFQQNGGSILLQKLSTRENSSQIQIFTQQELKKATNNFDESLIIGKGGFGTVFKGHLADNRIVAIKKSKIVDKSQSEQFANEVIVLSQINHRNVVKLLGCCLETEVPLLVYEFVNNGTLFDFIHTERKVNDATWKTRVRIAAEAAGALSYLHSEASIPIIHRDVKSANILLDDTYTAKVSDFGASRFIPLDQTELATIVQGTIGYLDPEYMQTSQLTEKSDVYSFGAVLVEMLTGEKPYSFGRPEEKRSLANHFLCCLKEDRLFDVLQVGILNEENEKEIKKVAILAAKCLRVNGEERPSMKEVAMELEMHQWINTDPNVKETDYLVHEASSNIYEPGDSSCHQEYDSITDQIPPALGDGR
ncbi:hypothetical protein JHK87_040020 [Glycine soja]|nr:hypothetical protein JHK87_040020 [Glycine soja]